MLWNLSSHHVTEYLFVALWLAYIAIRGYFEKHTVWSGTVVDRSKRDLPLLVPMFAGTLLLPLLYVATPWLSVCDVALPDALQWSGVAVLVGALWLFYRSHADLGQNWSVTLKIREDHELVTSGVYARVRHPMYTSLLAFALGQGLVIENWLVGWTSLVAGAVLVAVRLPREEAMLSERFGEPYTSYRRHTSALVPWRNH
jgi:protein-S-isoprenylcysteine O-methyltransferase Ste14